MTFVMDTAVGRADVLHRLALGIEPLDAATGRPVSSAVRVGQEVPPRMRAAPTKFESYWPCLDFESNGTARYKLRHGIGGPSRIKVNADGSPPTVVVRVDDPGRRFVPRRFRIPVWTRLELEAADPTAGNPPGGVYVAMPARLVRPVLSPGVAYPIPRGATVIRGIVVEDGLPVRWPRVAASVGGMASGFAHGDERGEFVLSLSNKGIAGAPQSKVAVTLAVRAVPRANAVTPDPADRLADLVVEVVNRPFPATVPGDDTPAGYHNHPVPTPVDIAVGQLTKLPPIVFQP